MPEKKSSPHSKAVKVVRIISRLNIGGPAFHVVHLTKGLVEYGYQTALVVGQEEATEGNMAEWAMKQGINLIIIPSLRRNIQFWRDLITFFRLFRLIRKLKPTIVHTHAAKAGALGRLAARLAGVPIILHTFHGHILEGYFSRTKSELFKTIERYLAKFTRRLIAVSKATAKDLLAMEIAPPAKIKVIHLGLDLAPFFQAENRKGEFKSALGLDKETPLVGLVARLVPIKNHQAFLRACALISAYRPQTFFAIIGDGELRRELEGWARLYHINQRVIFCGWQSDLVKVYADLDIVALTSHNEGLPVTIIEAMAAAKPVVAFKVGGVPELVEPGINGFVVEKGDVTSLANYMIDLLDDKVRRWVFGQNGRLKAFHNYQVSRLVKDTADLYYQLLRSLPTNSSVRR